MKEQLEDQIRNSFSGFEPKVDPSVWTQISAQLPAAPVVQPTAGGSVVKGLLTKLSSGAWWAIGTAAIVGGSVLIHSLMNDHSKKASTEVTKGIELSIEQQPIQPKKEDGVSEDIEKPSSSSSVISVPQSNSRSLPAPAVSKAEKVVSQSQISSTANGSMAENTTTSTAVTGNFTKTTSLSENRQTVATETKVQTSQHQDLQAEAQKQDEPLLILNTHGGFAPLQVTALINRESDKVTFDFGGRYRVAQTNSASYRFEEAGNYIVSCEVAGKKLEETVHVVGMLPSSFSPNGDGINDNFSAVSDELEMVDLKIVDREGHVAFSQKGKQVSWDGRLPTGQNAPESTYFYHIFATSVNGVTYEQRGTVRIFR